MKSLTDQLATYASYHRDRRNIATHFFGIPMILFSVIILLSRPIWTVESLGPISPALIFSLVVGLYYLSLDLPLGFLMAILLAVMVKCAHLLALASTDVWLAWGIGLFVVGWAIQSVGHLWEGKKPAFLDDVIGLIIGPLFVVTEVVLALGARQDLLAEIESRAGKTRLGKNLEGRRQP